MDMAPHEYDRIKAGIGMVASIDAYLQQALIHLVKKAFHLGLEIDKPRCMWVDAHSEAVIGPEFCDSPDALDKGSPLGG